MVLRDFDAGAPAFPIPKIVVVGRYTAHWSAGRATGSGEAGALLRFVPKGGTPGGGIMFNNGLEYGARGSEDGRRTRFEVLASEQAQQSGRLLFGADQSERLNEEV